MKSKISKNKLDSKIIAYASGAGAILAGVSDVNATIVTNTDLGLTAFTVNAGNTAVNWDINNMGGTDARVEFSNGFGTKMEMKFGAYDTDNQWVKKTNNTNAAFMDPMASSKFVKAALSAGYSFAGGISAQMTNTNVAQGGLVLAGTQFIGFKFDADGAGSIKFGWASITLNASSLTVNSWAYDNAGGQIQVGATAVPEPSETAAGLGLLALGAVGVSRYKSRRKAS